MTEAKILIVTRHKGLVEWLKMQDVIGEVYTKVTRLNVKGNHIYGTLPIYLAAEAKTYTTITIPRHQDLITEELTATEMVKAKAYMQTFEICKVK